MGEGTAGWQTDPTGRFEHRYWDGSAWTDNVSNAGVMSTDPFEPAGEASEVAASDPTAEQPAAPAPDEVTAPWPAAPAAPPPPTYVAPPPPDAGAGAPPPGTGSNRRVLVGAGILAVVAIVVAALLLGGDDGGGEDDIRAQLASQLRGGSGLSHEQAECVADAVIDDLGADRFDGVDFGADEPPPELADDLFTAAFDSFERCDIDPSDFDDSSSDSTEPEESNGTTETTDDILGGGSLPPDFEDQIAQVYEDSLGLPPDEAACLAGKIADAISSGDLTQDEAMSDVFSYLSDCGIELSEITGN